MVYILYTRFVISPSPPSDSLLWFLVHFSGSNESTSEFVELHAKSFNFDSTQTLLLESFNLKLIALSWNYDLQTVWPYERNIMLMTNSWKFIIQKWAWNVYNAYFKYGNWITIYEIE